MDKTSYEKIDDLLSEFEEKGALTRMNIEEAKYLKELLNEGRPKLNQIYAITLKDIESIKCVYNCHDYEDIFQHRFIPVNYNYNIKEDESVKDNVTFIKYVGNGKFIELYTNKIINLLDGKHIFNSKQESGIDYIEYMEEYEKYIESPLYIDFKNCQKLDKINTNRFTRNNKEKNNIIKYINNLEDISRTNIIDSMELLINKDYNYAIVENNIRTLKKG